MLINQTEYKNFIVFIIKSFKQLSSSFRFYLAVGSLKVKTKLSKSTIKNYPDRALQIAELGKKYTAEAFVKDDSPLGFPFNLKTSLISLPLAHDFKWSDLANLAIADQEVIISINRWYWLIYDQEQLFTTTAESIYKITKHWIRNNPYTESLIWEPYSISERISSLCIALLLKQDIALVKDRINDDEQLSVFFKQSIYHLTQHIEYYPNGITFNHVLNDLKGIATAAVIINDEQMLSTATDLIWQELDLIIDNDGFLREGSSHYQFIVTRWLCELEYVLIKAEKLNLATKLHSYAQAMINKVGFFLIDSKPDSKEIPLFGDISPDFDPAWIINYFSSAATSSLNKTDISYGEQILNEINLLVTSTDFNACSFNEYTRIDRGNWSLFVKHSSNNGTFFPAHAHEDYGNYVIFFNGTEIINDPGRENYLIPASSDPYCVPTAHNGLTINGLPVSLSVNYYYLTPGYKKANYKKHLSIEGGKTNLIIGTDSVKRIRSGKFKNYSRSFLVTDDTIQIVDNIEGESQPQIVSEITLSGQTQITNTFNGNYLLQADGYTRINLTVNNATVSTADSYLCRRYGNATDTTKIVINSTSNTLSIRYRAMM